MDHDGTMKHYGFSHMNSLSITHVHSECIYQSLKINSNYFNYKEYLYAEQYNTRYVGIAHGTQKSGYTFQQGGNQGGRYARFINRDYGNVRRFIVTLERRFVDYFGVKLDYTYQITEGNTSDPNAVFNNYQTDPPIEANKKVVPLDRDQCSALNLSVTVGDPGDWRVGVILGYSSGFPFIENIRISNGVRFENGCVKHPTINVDLRAEKTFDIYSVKLNTFVLVYNLLDTKNEYGVDAAFGRANVDIYTSEANPIIGLNTIHEYLNNPTSFSAPRQIRLGMQFGR